MLFVIAAAPVGPTGQRHGPLGARGNILLAIFFVMGIAAWIWWWRMRRKYGHSENIE